MRPSSRCSLISTCSRTAICRRSRPSTACCRCPRCGVWRPSGGSRSRRRRWRVGLRAGLLFDCARGEFDLGRIEEAAATATKALEIADRIGDQSKSASALMLLGNAAYRKGELAVARDFAEQALGLFRRLGDEARVAHARNNIGLIHKQLCEWDSALASFRSVLETQRRLGHYADTA